LAPARRPRFSAGACAWAAARPFRANWRGDPRLLERLASRLGQGCVVVTGTNGKTTSARMIAGVLRQAGLRPVHNRSGANLIEGVTTALVPGGRCRRL